MENRGNQYRSTAWELVLLSFLSLFIELLIIRWMSADLRAFTVFRSFPLITCFVGLGVGFALNRDSAYRLYLPGAICFALMMIVANLTFICFFGFPSLANFQWQNLVVLISSPNLPSMLLFSTIIILMLSGPFIMSLAIGSRLGILFNRLPALPAYSFNILGAIAGSMAMPLFCWLGCPPWVLLVAASGAILWLQRSTSTGAQTLTNAIMLTIVAGLFPLVPSQFSIPHLPELLKMDSKRVTLWSPYQRLDLTTFHERLGYPAEGQATGKGAGKFSRKVPAEKATAAGEPFVGLEIGANRAFYQYLFSRYAFHHSKLSATNYLRGLDKDYRFAFALNHPSSALIVGAGTGQNVSAAVDSGVDRIDAVEIDPVILSVGLKFNPDYHSPHVHLLCDDARHYFVHCRKKYDLIDFSTLDSHAVAGLGSSVRIDAYIYTEQSIRRALSLLNDNGLVVCSFATVAPWTKDRLYVTFKEASGYAPLCLEGKQIGTIFVLGKPVKDGRLATLPLVRQYAPATPANPRARVLTDDWPYLYVRDDIIDYPYLLVVMQIIALSLFAGRRLLFGNHEALNWQMFFLGAAFMLLELHAISFLSLLYGSTWMTSATAITGILIMILCANISVLKFDRFFARHNMLPYIVLLSAVTADYFLPAERMLSLEAAGHALATVTTLLPLALAGIVFANAFKRVKNTPEALAFNLFGAVIGGLLEYVSNYTGIKSLMIVGFLLYSVALLCNRMSTATVATASRP